MMTSHGAAINQSGVRTGHMVRGSSPKTAQNQMLTLNAYNSALLQWILILFFAASVKRSTQYAGRQVGKLHELHKLHNYD